MGDSPNFVDVHVGSRLRLIRLSKRLSAEQLAQKLDISELDLVRYEQGKSRIGPKLMFTMCDTLCVPPESFFESTPRDNESSNDPLHPELRQSVSQTTELLAKFLEIDDPSVRQQVIEFCRTLTDK